MDRSEGKSPRPTVWDWVLPESKGSARREQAQRDSEEARRSGQRGSLDRSEGRSPAAAGRGRILPEAEGKGASVLAASQRDNKESAEPS